MLLKGIVLRPLCPPSAARPTSPQPAPHPLSGEAQFGLVPLIMSGERNRSAGKVQVRERQQREHLSGVLGEAAIANFAIAELALHHKEHMLDLRAHFAKPA